MKKMARTPLNEPATGHAWLVSRIPGRRALPLVVAMIMAAASVAVFGGGQQARADDPPVAVIGQWRPSVVYPGAVNYFDAVQVMPDPANRLLYAYAPQWLAAYNLDSLQPRGAGLVTAGTATARFVDPGSGTLFIGFLQTGQGGSARLDQYTSAPDGVKLLSTIDLTKEVQGRQISGIYRPPRSKVMWLLTEPVRVGGQQGSQALAGGLQVIELRLQAPGQPPVFGWAHPLPTCYATMKKEAASAGMGYVPLQKALYFACGNGSQPIFVKTPYPRGIARLVLAADPFEGASPEPPPEAFTIFGRDGDYFVADSLFDPGSNRIVFSALGGGGSTVYAFDANINKYVGGISAGGNQILQPGLDPVIGRYYGATSGGLVISDVATTPLAQGIALNEFSHWVDSNGKHPITDNDMAVDPVTHRLFLKYSGLADFIVVQDRIPPYVAPLPPNPDAPTVDVEEQPGLTSSTFSAASQGYAFRTRQVGGLAAFITNYSVTGFDGRIVSTAAGPGTRELRGAYLNSAGLGDSEASMSIISTDSDRSNTQGDLSKTGPPDPANPTGSPQAPLVNWPVAPAFCFDFGGGATNNLEKDGSRVTCDAGSHRADASSESRSMTVNEDIGMQSGHLTTTLRLDKEDGVVSTVTATAKGITVLGEVLKIGDVQTTATSKAHGRKGSAKSEFKREVSKVFLNGNLLCEKDCDTQTVADTVNRNLAGRVRIEFPSPEERSEASPGGYQALIRRVPGEALEETILNEQPPDRLEVPGMVITVFQDVLVPGRTVTELAAVETEARYGISLLGGDFEDTLPLLDLPGEGPLFGLPAGADLDAGGSLSDISGGTGGGSSDQPQGIVSGTPVSTAGRLIWNGLRSGLKLWPIWAVLLAPIYLSARRWLLLQRSTLSTGGTR
jgi:hypothetical protein